MWSRLAKRVRKEGAEHRRASNSVRSINFWEFRLQSIVTLENDIDHCPVDQFDTARLQIALANNGDHAHSWKLSSDPPHGSHPAIDSKWEQRDALLWRPDPSVRVRRRVS